jgi:carbonic anhydrase
MSMIYRQFLVLALLAAMAAPVCAAETVSNFSPQEVLTTLRAGNERYLSGAPGAWSADSEKREMLANGQHPMACIVTCADSRVAPEILFDQSLGDLFVCRVAGNVITPEMTGSIEYAVDHLNVPVVIVMGHTKCGAVQAAISSPDATGPIGSLISHIKAAVEGCMQSGTEGAELLNCAVNTNANNGCIALIQGSRAIQEKVEKGECILISATYDITTGEIDWQTQLAAVNLNSKKTEANSADAHSTENGQTQAAAKSKAQSDHMSASRTKSEKSTTKQSRRY